MREAEEEKENPGNTAPGSGDADNGDIHRRPATSTVGALRFAPLI
jgi:hypothetical protein